MANPSFESANATTGDISATGVITPDWNITSISYSRMAIFNSSSTISTYGGTSSPSDGNYFLMIRSNLDQGKTQNIKQNSDMSLPKGKYTVSFDYKAARVKDVNRNLTISAISGSTTLSSKTIAIPKVAANSSYFNELNWSTASYEFTLENTTNVRINISCETQGTANSGSSQHTVVLLDNFVINYSNINGPTLAALIAQAKSINAAKGGLDDAISAAETAYEGINHTPEYQETIDNAITTLKTAIATRLTDIGFTHRDDVSYVIANAGFEGMEAETADYTTVEGKDYSADGWMLARTCDSGRSAVLSYGSGKKVNQASVPASDNEGNTTGKAMGLSVGWAGIQLYNTAPVTLPAGKYILKVHGYNAGTNTSLTSQFGFVTTGGTSYLSTKTSYALNTWEEEEVVFTLAEATEGQFQFGGVAAAGSATNTAQVFYDNISLVYTTEIGYAQDEWETAKSAAETAYANGDYACVTGTEKTNLKTEIDKAEPSNIDGYNTATTALTTATTTFTAAKTAYDKFDAAKTNAIALGVSAGAIVRPTSADNLQTALRTLYVQEDAAVRENYTLSANSLMEPWTTSNTETKTGQHWDGTASTSYFNKWSGDAFNMSVSKTTTLPAGTYVLKVAARTNCSAENGLYASVKIGDADATCEYFDVMNGEGYGIDLTGNANYDEAGDYANDDKGRGWQWRFVAFTIGDGDTEKSVTLGAFANMTANTWASIADITLLTTADNTEICRQMWSAAKTTAETARDNATYVNVTGSERTALQTAIDATETTTAAWYTTQKATLGTATATFTNATTVANYNRLAAAISEATAIGTDHSSYDATSSTTAAGALANANTLYTAMLNAQKTAKAQGAKVIGFETGEYAPYENIAIVNALTAANAIESVAETETATLDAAINGLAAANWTVNAAEVNAIYDGTLAKAPIQATSENVVLPGWKATSGNIRQTFKGAESKACLSDADDQVGVFVHPGTYVYGENEGYTMPLKANTAYIVKAKYCSWQDNSNNGFSLTIHKGNTQVATKNYGANKTASTTADALREVSLTFVADADADYTLSVFTDGNTFMTDFYLLKATTLTISDTDVAANVLKGFTNPLNITVNRTLVADKWQGFSLPFNLTASELSTALPGAQLVKFKSADENVINFETATTVEAGEPYLIKPAAGENISTLTFTGKTIAADIDNVERGTDDYKFKAQLFADELPTDGTVAYMSTATQKLKKLTSGNINGTRSYFVIPAGVDPDAARITINGWETTGISDLKQKAESRKQMFDLQGRRVEKAQRGLYIVNGKKVMVK